MTATLDDLSHLVARLPARGRFLASVHPDTGDVHTAGLILTRETFAEARKRWPGKFTGATKAGAACSW